MQVDQIGNGWWIEGDCFEAMSEIEDGSVDMVLADLPYGTTQNKWDSVLDLDALWAEYLRVVKPNGAIVLTATQPFSSILAVKGLEWFRYEWIWRKTRATGHLNAKRQPMRAHESILVFCRESPPYSPQGLVKKAIPTIRKGGNNGTNYGKSDKDAVQEHGNYPLTVLEIGSEGKAFHPTQKPVALFEYLIRTYTDAGMTVLDNTAGSGTTAIAAENAGRKWICIERDPEYSAKARERIHNHVNSAKEAA